MLNIKLNYVFSNLCGCMYKQGNIIFTPDGNSVLSPVGNRVTQFDLKNNKSTTFPFQNRKNISRIALSPDGDLLLSVDDDGRLILVNLYRKVVLQHINLKLPVKDIKFSPDGSLISVTHGRILDIWYSPTKVKKFASFQRFNSFRGHSDKITCIDWSSDSEFVATGSADMTVRVFSMHRIYGYRSIRLAGHRNTLVGCFFEKNSLSLYTLCKGSVLLYWSCDVSLEEARELRERAVTEEGRKLGFEQSSEKDLFFFDKERDEEEASSSDEDNKYESIAKRIKKSNSIVWTRSDKHILNTEHHSTISSACYSSHIRILVVGFKNGVFVLYETPSLVQIHSLSVSQHAINSAALNTSGQWLALASKTLGQLVVWEWSSETFILKQQGHSLGMSCLTYSPDGEVIVTGGQDGKVKLWSTATSFCFATFGEHTGPVTGVCYNAVGQVIISASLDGTVRAFDTKRYRNFRTYTSPDPAQFSSLAVDFSGELICAGSQDTFEIYLWSLETGKLLEILRGHTGPISWLQFSPLGSLLASSSWDKSYRLWDPINPEGNNEHVEFVTEAVALCYSPNGKELAVSTLDAQITFWNVEESLQTGSIECRRDIWSGRRTEDLVTTRHLASTKCFTSIAYTADGSCLLAGGRSKYICIYDVPTKILLRRYQISGNRSYDAMQRYLDSRKMTEAGPEDLIEISSESESEDIQLPGVVKGEHSSRKTRPEIETRGVQFSPTGLSWAAVTTDGLMVYSLDQGLTFDPFELGTDITPGAVIQAILSEHYMEALVYSVHLNEQSLLQRAIESVPTDQIKLIMSTLPFRYIPKLIPHFAHFLSSTTHLQFYMQWIQSLLLYHGRSIQGEIVTLAPGLTALQNSIHEKMADLSSLTDSNKFRLDYFIMVQQRDKAVNNT
ncbi:hypothetical protein LOD99_4103 [Oopsacas minuta]|uniref:Small-subunit processome Utp12 domain-containing protein n=1 Tax=Oopsacas minuta TaxID=111878 RepID=A0AAV7JV74_9METZ|nr:hypothetical protein LOD99_4103 [Oopsacas minuta]